MMSERRFREMESQHRIACNLCGSNGASVRCDKCQCMAFCLSCDDMYHRHPKRRYHLRKAVALEVPAKYLDGCPQINKTYLQNDGHSSGLHPSKMPVPPPRRKKKGITLSSIKETFTSTGNKLRRFVSNEKLSIPPVNGNRFLNECRPKETPLIDKPMQTIRTQTLQNQRGVLPQNNSFGTLPTVRRHHSISVKLPETQPTPPPLPPPPRPKEAKPMEAVYQNYRKTSLPARNSTINGNVGKVSSSIGNLSQEVPTSAVPERKIITDTFDRRNCSFNDLRTNTSIDDISSVNSQQFCQHFHPNQYCYGLPIHPWTTSSLNNSIEDINLNDVEDYDSDISARHNLNRNKRASIKRCKSAFQMYQSMSPCPPMQPFVYPYYYGYPCSGHTTPLPTCASPHPIRPFNMSSRGSVENMSTTSSSRGKPSTKVKLNHKPKPDPLESREQFSDSGGRSVTSSSRQQSDFDDDEDFFSVSENDSSDEDSLSRQQNNSGQWSCRFCTFLNDKKNTICEICSKTNKKLKKTSNKSGVKVIRKKTNDNKSKPIQQFLSNNNNKTNNNRNKVIELDFDEKLINEQKEIEKELIRRLENERRIEEENEKICRKEEYIKKKNLGLQVEDTLIEQIRKDQEFNHLNNDKNELKIESNEVNGEKNSEQKGVENKSTECQTNEEKVNEIKTTDTSIQTKSEHFSKNLDEKCAKSIQCQIDDKSTVKLNDKPIENSDNRTVEQNIQNSSLNSESNSVTNRQTNQFNGNNSYNNFGHQNQQNMSNPMMTSMGQQFNDYNDRRTAYGSETMFNQNSNQFQSPYNNYPMNPMTPLMSPNIMSMNPLMSGYPMVPPMFSSNPLQNMYSSPYPQSLNGSQTGLDRFGYRSNSITNEQSFINPLQSQIGSRYSSCENLHSITQLNEKNQQKSPIDSGLQLVQVLRDAEKNGFTSVDVEVALNFSPDKPIEWLEENWNNMCETVLTLTNNQIMQNQIKSGNKRLNQSNLLTEEEAKEGLRSTKGNIWQAIEKCVKTKQNKVIKDINDSNIALDDKNKGSFSLKISGFGSGRDNEDINENIETTEVEEQQVLVERQSDKVLLTALTVHTSEVQRIETNADRKTMERLLTDWKIEKLSSDRFRQQEKERQKIRKFMELQKKMSEFDSDDSEQEVEFHDVPNNNPGLEESPLTAVDDNELPDQVSGDISEEKWQINSEFEFINKSLENNVSEVIERDVNEVSDFEEYNSNSESDLSDEFDEIDARIQAKLRDNFNLAKNENLPSNEPISSEVIEKLVEKFGENSLSGNQRIDDLKQTLIESNAEPNAVNSENLEPIDVKSETKKEISESEAKEMMTEIDRNVRRSLEELEQMELNVLQSQINNQESAANQMYDESFGWARTEYECELCCEIYSINDLVAMISCTHYACKECLQKYYCVQIREAQRLIIRCPFCDQPDMDPDDDDKVFEYLGLLDQMLKHLVPLDVYELFQRKLRDRALMRDPGFLWCTQCSSGFIAPNPQAKTIMCPDCKNLTCTLCKKKWRKQHMDITCEQFAEWEKANDPSFAEQQLDKHLKEFGIECPNCKFRYQLAKGGCMHFRCSQCSYDFCGGCARPFKMGNRCGISPYCEKLGLHSHHPRNCLFYLRDKDTDKLQTLLDKHKIKYKTKLESDHKSNRCPVMEQKHTSYGLKDEACNRFTENAGLCRLHYKEYLGDLIWRNGIDPIHIFNDDELELVLKRENIKLPPRDLSDRRQEYKEEYHKQMIDLIVERVPLNLNH